MISCIHHISSRCGGGKSTRSIQYLCNKLINEYPEEKKVIFASVTKDLNAQNYQEFIKCLGNYSSQNSDHIGCVKIDDRDYKGHVAETVSECLKSDFSGVIFTTHAVLNFIKPELFYDVALVCDEIPQNLVRTLSVQHKLMDRGDIWESAISTYPSSNPSFEEVRLSMDVDRYKVESFIRDIKASNDNVRSEALADLFRALLDGNEKVYVTSRNEEGGEYKYYQTVIWLKAKLIAEQVSSWTILSAQLKESLFGFVIQYCLNMSIENVSIDPSSPLEMTHKNKVKIIPFLKKDMWSKTLKMKNVKESLNYDDLVKLQSDLTVGEYAQEFAAKMMPDDNFFITINEKDKRSNFAKENPERVVKIFVQGMNHLVKYDHAAYLAATVPKITEMAHLHIFAKDYGVSTDVIEKAIMVERCYERAYQVLARTSIRKRSPDPEKEHVLIVPDEKHADYIKDWFDPRFRSVDNSQSLIKRLSEKELKALDNKNKTIRVLRDYQQGKGTYRYLADLHCINYSTFKECRKRHKDEFIKMGLPVPNA